MPQGCRPDTPPQPRAGAGGRGRWTDMPLKSQLGKVRVMGGGRRLITQVKSKYLVLAFSKMGTVFYQSKVPWAFNWRFRLVDSNYIHWKTLRGCAYIM